MQANLITDKQPEPCPSCVAIPKPGAILCTNCHHIFDVVQAYKNTRIAYGAVEMDRLTAEQWKIVEQIKAERDRARGKSA
jgi:uncharacterized Zn finger protein (UPF0148 family)